jgi:4-amino-4-deoxy-L-arabinose transferase-like glycosyltransferase
MFGVDINALFSPFRHACCRLGSAANLLYSSPRRCQEFPVADVELRVFLMVRSSLFDRHTVILMAVLAVYVVFQITCTLNILAYLPNGFPTENFYHPLARNLLLHGVYAMGEAPVLEPSTFRPPFYAIVLSTAYRIFGLHEAVGVVMNNVLLTSTLILVYLIGRRINPITGLIAVVLLMSDTIFLAEANRNQSDLLFTFLLTTMAWCFLNGFSSRRHAVWLLAGCAIVGLAVFTRAAAMYLWLPLSLSFVITYWHRLPARRIAFFIVAVIVIEAAFVVPWMLRNQDISGNNDYAGMQSSHIVHFWAPLLIAKRLGISSEEAKSQILADERNDPAAPKGDPEGGAHEIYLNKIGKQLILENAAYIPHVMFDNLPRMFISYASEPLVALLSAKKFAAWQSIDQYSFGTSAWSLERRLAVMKTYFDKGLIWVIGYGFIVKLVNAMVFFMSFTGIFLMVRSGNRQWRDTAWFFFLVYGCITLIALLVTQGRFRVPVMPAFALTAAFAVHYFWQKLRARYVLSRQ